MLYLNIAGHQYRLEHGDALCTDSISIEFKIIRNPFLVAFLRRTPLSFRTKLVNGFRKSRIQTNVKKL